MSKLVVGVNDLQTTHPDLVKEWDWEKNGVLSPCDYSYGSEQSVFWKCSKGHSWSTTINSRTSTGCGCPYCSGRRVISGENDLFSNYPDISKEWHPTKNGELKPSDVTAKSNRKVWWLCSEGHSYEARICNRTNLNRGCPYCSGNKTLEGYNDLKTWCLLNNRKDLLREWDYDKNMCDPSHISAKNSKKVWWKCSLGHEWDCTIGSRTYGRTTGCPYCSNPPKRVLYGYNDFETYCVNNHRGYLLEEWDYTKNKGFSPKEITYGSGKRVWWRCNRGHEWCVAPAYRIKGAGCKVCSKTQTSFPEQAIAYYLAKTYRVVQRYREQGYEIDIYLPDNKIGIEYDGMYYHDDTKKEREANKDAYYREQGISLIHVKEDSHRSEVLNGVVYYVPSKKFYMNVNFNEMMLSLLSLVEQITGLQADKDVDITRDEFKIRKQYASVIKNSSVAAVNPELIPEWDVEKNNGLTPECFSANAHIKVWWKCNEGHSWQAEIASRNRNLGCPFCAGQRTIQGQNDFESWCRNNNPNLLLEWDYSKNEALPSEISKTSNKKYWWICSRGHEWQAVLANRTHGTRCPVCFNGNNSKLQKTTLYDWCKENNQEQLLVEWNSQKNGSVTPKNVSKGSHIKVWWKCSKGHEWEAQIKSRTYNHGCPYCSGTNKRAVTGDNDLVTWCVANDKQYILDEWDYEQNAGLRPELLTFSSHKRINWKCKKGHTWSAVVKERTKFKGNMCPICRNDR